MEIQGHHIERLNKIGSVAHEINIQLGQIWHSESSDQYKDYRNPEFRKVESLYCQARDLAADMLDIANLSSRLEDFIGKREMKTNSVDSINEIVELKPNIMGFGINLNAIIKRFRKHKE